MNHITLYLQKFANVAPQHGHIKAVVVEAVEKLTGVKVDENAVQVRSSEIRIKAEPTLRAELFIRREQLEEILAQSVRGVQIAKV